MSLWHEIYAKCTYKCFLFGKFVTFVLIYFSLYFWMTLTLYSYHPWSNVLNTVMCELFHPLACSASLKQCVLPTKTLVPTAPTSQEWLRSHEPFSQDLGNWTRLLSTISRCRCQVVRVGTEGRSVTHQYLKRHARLGVCETFAPGMSFSEDLMGQSELSMVRFLLVVKTV